MESPTTDMTQLWLSPANWEAFANSIHQSGAAHDNYWGFVDGTVCPVCHLGNECFTMNTTKCIPLSSSGSSKWTSCQFILDPLKAKGKTVECLQILDS